MPDLPPTGSGAGFGDDQPTVPRGAPRSTRRSARSSRRRPVTRPQALNSPTLPPARPVPSPPGTGRSPWGGYRLGDELGRGGMGRVCLAADDRLNRSVAVKMLVQTDSKSAVRFVEEARITGQLEHPNIVPVHALGHESDGTPWMAMKCIEGESLKDLIKRDPLQPLTPEDIDEILMIFHKVCDAVAFAHSRGVVHRDLKPANVMVGEWGEVLVVDWGLAKALHTTDEDLPAQPEPTGARAGTGRFPTRMPTSVDLGETNRQDTLEGEVFGTPSFMPPEQALGRVDELDERSDIFSLGGILYSLLTGKPPYEGDSVYKLVALAAQRELPPPRQRAPERRIPRELAAIVMKAMAKRQRDRYQTVREMQDDLAGFRSFAPTSAYRPGPMGRLLKWARRHPAVSLAAGVSLVFSLLVVLLLAQLQLANQARDRAAAERAQAEEKALREAAERERAEAQADAQAQRALVAQAAEAAARGELSEVRSLLVKQATGARNAAADEFSRIYSDALARGVTPDRMLEDIGEHRIREFLTAFNELEVASQKADYVMTAEDYHWRGLLRLYLGDADGALLDFNASARTDPDYAFVYNERGQVKRELGDLQGAIADFTRALELDGDSWAARQNRGLLYAQIGDREAAMRDFNETLTSTPNPAPTLINRGLLKLDLDDPVGAIDDFTAAIEMAPGMAEAHHNRALAYAAIGNMQAAIDGYTVAIEISPGYHPARHNRGHIYLNSDRLDLAIADFDVVVRAGGEGLAPALYCRALARHKKGQLQAAIVDIDRAIQLNPAYPDQYTARADIRIDMGDRPAAYADLDRALQLDGRNVDALTRRAILRGQDGDMDRAVTDFTAAIEANPTVRRSWLNRARAWTLTNRHENAIADISRALQIEADAATHILRAQALRRMGKKAESIADYEAASKLDTTRWDILADLGTMLAETGDRERGVQELQRAFLKCPDAAIRQRLADAIRQFGGRVPE